MFSCDSGGMWVMCRDRCGLLQFYWRSWPRWGREIYFHQLGLSASLLCFEWTFSQSILLWPRIASSLTLEKEVSTPSIFSPRTGRYGAGARASEKRVRKRKGKRKRERQRGRKIDKVNHARMTNVLHNCRESLPVFINGRRAAGRRAAFRNPPTSPPKDQNLWAFAAANHYEP